MEKANQLDTGIASSRAAVVQSTIDISDFLQIVTEIVKKNGVNDHEPRLFVLTNGETMATTQIS